MEGLKSTIEHSINHVPIPDSTFKPINDSFEVRNGFEHLNTQTAENLLNLDCFKFVPQF